MHQCGGPFTGQAQDRALGGRIGAGLALAGKRGLGRDVHDGSAAFLEIRHGRVDQLVIVSQVAVKRFLELTPSSGLEILVVVLSGVIHNAIDMAVLLVCCFDDAGDLVGVVEVKQVHIIGGGVLLDILLELVESAVGSINHHRDGPLLGQLQRDAFADAFKTAGDDDDFAFEMQIHGNSFVHPYSAFHGCSMSRPAGASAPQPEWLCVVVLSCVV